MKQALVQSLHAALVQLNALHHASHATAFFPLRQPISSPQASHPIAPHALRVHHDGQSGGGLGRGGRGGYGATNVLAAPGSDGDATDGGAHPTSAARHPAHLASAQENAPHQASHATAFLP